MIIHGINRLDVPLTVYKTASALSTAQDSPLLQLLQKCNNFIYQGMNSQQGECLPLYACGTQIGIIRPEIADHLEEYPEVFINTANGFFLNPKLDTFSSRTEAVDAVLRDLHSKNVLLALRGWRGESFNVWSNFGTEPLFEIERSAVTIFGIRAFGIHINGYTKRPDGTLAMWVQKRAANKPTWPGMLDSMVGGGITAGLKPSQVLLKEAQEEASIPENLAMTARPAGTVSFFTESERGLHANNEFVFDLELPYDFKPKNSDGEVEGFELISFPDLVSRVISPKYKLTSTPVAIDFMIRHGMINCDNEPNLPALQELLHIPLHHFYKLSPSPDQ